MPDFPHMPMLRAPAENASPRDLRDTVRRAWEYELSIPNVAGGAPFVPVARTLLEQVVTTLDRAFPATFVTPLTADSSGVQPETQGATSGVRARGREGVPPSAPPADDCPPVTVRALADEVRKAADALQSAMNRASEAGLDLDVTAEAYATRYEFGFPTRETPLYRVRAITRLRV